MVNFYIVSKYNSNPPSSGKLGKISGGPLYLLADVQQLTQSAEALKLWTSKCYSDVMQLGIDTEDVGNLIRQLDVKDYRDSEWCENGSGAIAACDAYTIRQLEWSEVTDKNISSEYFLKFAISKTGALVLVVSCHLSN